MYESYKDGYDLLLVSGINHQLTMFIMYMYMFRPLWIEIQWIALVVKQ